MSTSNDEEMDYQQYMRENAPNPALQHRGLAARQARREASKTRITIRIDDDILEEFKRMAPEGRGYQGLMNLALREWLTAKEVRELVRSELAELVNKAVSSIETAAQASKHE